MWSIGCEAWLVNLYHPDICPACSDFYECTRKYADHAKIEKLCPIEVDFQECKGNNFSYPDKCIDGKEKIAENPDAAIWFQCCK
jgi:hypothetical protein